MDKYNGYIQPQPGYRSEIAFINTSPAIITRRVFYVEFAKEKGQKDGFYLDNKYYLDSLYKKVRWGSRSGNRFAPNSEFEDDDVKYLRESKDYIRRVDTQVQYYSYIKVIKDIQNPQLEGQIMLLKYGRKIHDHISAYIVDKKGFNHTYEINVKLTSGFPNYDNSRFTDTEMVLVDNKLNLDTEVKFKTINILSIERKEKLQKIANSEVDYEKILKSVPIEEIKKYLENNIF